MESESFDSLATDPPAGIGFMGNEWDGDKGGRSQWIGWLADIMREVHRVLKPGAHGLVWAIPRTSHWTMTALEEAGFEVRDVITHLFGTGFPKSLDVSKAIDKAAGAKREVVATVRNKGINGMPDGRASRSSEAWDRDCGGTMEITVPATDSARQWQGWGTALKPAAEFWILVRKPLGEKTVAANVLKHGTGAVNIDGSRIAGAPESPGSTPDTRSGKSNSLNEIHRVPYDASRGRFPANVLLSHSEGCGETCAEGCAVAALDRQSGFTRTPSKVTRGAGGQHGAYSPIGRQDNVPCFGDSGGASRFFYCAKASKKDRGPENKHPTVKSSELMGYLIRLVTPPGGTVLDPFMGSGSTGVAAGNNGFGFTGIEIDSEYFETAKDRVGGAS